MTSDSDNTNTMVLKVWIFSLSVLVISNIMFFFQDHFMLSPIYLILTNSTIWLPQVVKTYNLRSRSGPSTLLSVIVSVSISLLPLYLKINEQNFMEVEPGYYTSIMMLSILSLTNGVMIIQKRWGGRWFMPKRWRSVDPNIFIYTQPIPNSVLEKIKIE